MTTITRTASPKEIADAAFFLEIPVVKFFIFTLSHRP
jgi:hypothetical protein